MRHDRDQQQQTGRRILRSAGRGFRSKGFGGIGVDALAKAAQVTSGAFYGHFRSKIDAFRAALTTGIDELTHGIATTQARHGDRWIEELAAFYFTDRVTCDLADGCALPSLAGEVSRGDAKTKATFEKSYRELVDQLAAGLSADAEARAIVMTALFVGGVTIARAVKRPELRDRIAKVLQAAVVASARQ